MTSVNDAYDPGTGELTDFECAIYYKLLEVLTKLDVLSTSINSLNAYVSTTSSQASTLVSEYYGNQDMDSNGLIYGFDFYITDPPEILKQIPKRGLSMTWAAYLASMQ